MAVYYSLPLVWEIMVLRRKTFTRIVASSFTDDQ